MKKWLITLILIVVMVQIVQSSICCEINQDCLIVEHCPDKACGNCSITIYNRTGSILMEDNQMGGAGTFVYTYNASKNLTQYDYYPYTVNCTNNRICKGDCSVEIKSDCGKDNKMIISITAFLILINIGLFILPFKWKFSKNVVTDFVMKRLTWIAALMLLWFNTTIFRQMSSNFGLNIDNFLIVYWWIFTIGVFFGIFVMCYLMVVGVMGLMKQIKMRKRMGDDYQGQENRYHF